MAFQRPVFAVNANGFAGLIDKNNYQKVLFWRQGYHQVIDEELIAGLIELANNPTYLENTAAESLKIIRFYYNIVDIVNQLEEVYFSAIN
jgi:hypothetical protein